MGAIYCYASKITVCIHVLTRFDAAGAEIWRLDPGTDDLLGFTTFASDLYVVE